MHFIERQPSATWEPLPLLGSPQHVVWAWFKPAGAPNGVCFQVPDETFRDPSRRVPLTVRALLQSAGLDPRMVAAWTNFGVAHDGQNGANPALDAVIPDPGQAIDRTIGVYLTVPPSYSPPTAAPTTAAPGGAPAEIFSRMEVAWDASFQLELQLAGVAKQLSAMAARINSLNRDLSPEEFRYADQQDKREWQEARRWLRDIANRLGRSIKDHAIGLTSDAGRRTGYEAIYKQYVVPRRSFDGLQQAERDFESYRKSLQTLLNNMVAVHGTASQEGERRAQQILTRISARVRASRAKR